jgi:hypothetical protein
MLGCRSTRPPLYICNITIRTIHCHYMHTKALLSIVHILGMRTIGWKGSDDERDDNEDPADGGGEWCCHRRRQCCASLKKKAVLRTFWIGNGESRSWGLWYDGHPGCVSLYIKLCEWDI